MSGKVSAFNAFLWDAAEEVLQALHTFPSPRERDPQFSRAGLQQSLGVPLLIVLAPKSSLSSWTLSSQGPSGLSITNLFQSINLLWLLNSENSKEKSPVDSLIVAFPKRDWQE